MFVLVLALEKVGVTGKIAEILSKGDAIFGYGLACTVVEDGSVGPCFLKLLQPVNNVSFFHSAAGVVHMR